jgi:hypothetical protein
MTTMPAEHVVQREAASLKQPPGAGKGAPPLTPAIWPPGVALAEEHERKLSNQVLWWVARARGIGGRALADLCQSTPTKVLRALWGLESQRYVLRTPLPFTREDTFALTNGGLLALAYQTQLTPVRLGRRLGWNFSQEGWDQQGVTDVADHFWQPGAIPSGHRRGIYALLAQAARECRLADLTYWGVELEQIWLEHEVGQMMGKVGPCPDGALIWRLPGHTWLRYFLEYETGSRRPTETAAKLPLYATYAQSARCRTTWERLPPVLFLAPDAGYETTLARALLAEQQRASVFVPVLLTHLGLLRAYRWIDPIWRVPGPGPAAGDERATCWGREESELLLSGKEEQFLRRASQVNKL